VDLFYIESTNIKFFISFTDVLTATIEHQDEEDETITGTGGDGINNAVNRNDDESGSADQQQQNAGLSTRGIIFN
jgi:hypothetical protein